VLTEATQDRVCRDIDESMRASHRAAPLGSVPRTPYRTIRRPRSAPNRNGLLRRELGRLVGFVIGVVALLMLVGSGLPAQVAELLTSVMTSEGASDAPPPRKEPGDKKVKRNSSVEPRDRQHTPHPNR
jgi:hypothetical protein